MSPKNYYINRVEELNLKLKNLKKESSQFVGLRLLSFLSIPTAIYFLFNHPGIAVLAALSLLILFLFAVRKSLDVKENIAFHKAMVKINENELLVLEGDFSNFSNGKEYINPNHPNSYDMDLFGPKSVYQYLNRTISQKGADLLADFLQKGRDSIHAFHTSTKALLKEVEWTQKFRAKGMRDDAKDETFINTWSEQKLKNPKFVSIARIVFPIIAFSALLAKILDKISDSEFLLILIFCLFPVMFLIKKTMHEAGKLSKIKGRLKTLRGQIHLMQELKAEDEIISEAKKILFEGKENANDALKSLAQLSEKFDMRLNFLISILFNMFIAYDLQLMHKLEKWKFKYADKIVLWEKQLLKMEVLISQMNFYYNYSNQLTFPELTEDRRAKIKLKNIGHPFLLSGNMVSNDFHINEDENYVIITGPNMAGKSTFLRSVGVNLVLAQAGFATVSEAFSFPNLKLYTSMRTADNLTEESSYFHAELVRLRFIVDAIERGEKVFIVLDEILKGTNSKDKEEGSAKFLKKLISLHSKGIIATHDLSLTQLALSDDKIRNQYFDSTISGEDISFSYKIENGIVQNMNASFLLKKMNLV